MRLRALAPGKVNLCLLLGPTRKSDGRHELATLFQSVSLADELTLENGVRDAVRCPAVEGENLVAAALEALRARGWEGPPLQIEIVKRIPLAGGMGGGSADAAAALRLARELAPASTEALAEIAVSLGADVPSQLTPGLVLGTGAGEHVQPLPPLAPHAFVIVPQRHGLATAAVFREADRLGLPRSQADLAAGHQRLRVGLVPGARLPAELVVNDLEPAAISVLPQVADALRAVREAGADDALVSGSGPTVAGVFWGPDAPARADAAARTLSTHDPPAQPAVPVAAGFGAPRRLASAQ